MQNETHTIGPGIWRETLKNVKNEKCTLYELEYGKKTEKEEKCEKPLVETGIW
jgi:hypothetical protein